MPTLPVLKARGLYTGDNALSAVPDGAMVRADNVVIGSLDTVEPRPGQRYEALGFGYFSGVSRARAMTFYRGGRVLLYEVVAVAGFALGTSATADAAYTTVATPIAEPDPALLRMKFVELAENLYLTTSLGTYVTESLGATPVPAGIPKALQLQVRAYPDFHSWMPVNTAAAYAYVWGRKDGNGNVKLGAPSNVAIVRNYPLNVAIGGIVRTAADGSHPNKRVTVTYTKNLNAEPPAVGQAWTLGPGEANFAAGAKTVVTVTPVNDVAGAFTYDEAGTNTASLAPATFSWAAGGVCFVSYFPPEVTITSGHFARFYRSKTIIDATGLLIPSLDLFQIGELPYNVAGTMSFADGVPDLMLEGAPPLYTSPNFGDGIGASNERPPMAKDLFEFDGRLWFVNTTDRHRFFLSLLGIGMPGGVQNNDTLTLGGVTYTFKTAAPATAAEVEIELDGSAALNIEKTALNLVRRILANGASAAVRAYYISGIDDAPGRILLEETAIGGAAFAVTASRAASWFPALPTSGTSASSDNSRRAHGLSYSKVGEPEAVPLTNYVTGIPRGRAAVRGLPLRDKAFILVQNVGIYILTGPAPYRIEKLDTTAKPLVPDTFVEHSNQIIGLTDQGVVSISEGGVRILSAPIDVDLRALVGLYLANVKLRAFAVSHEADRQYQLWLPANIMDPYATFAWVYNSLRNGWTKWSGNRTCGGVNPADGVLCLGDGTANKLRLDRRSYVGVNSLALAFADETLTVNVTAVAADNLSCTLASATGVAAGDVLTIDSFGGRAKLVTAVNGNTLTIAASNAVAYPVPIGAACLIWKAIACDVKYVPPKTGDPAVLKQFREASFHFARLSAYGLQTYFDSEKGHVETVGKTLRTSDFTAPGTATAKALLSANKRSEVPIEHQRSTQMQVGLRITEAFARWRLNGYSVTYDALTEKSED